MNELIEKVKVWADNKGLLKPENAKTQMLKVVSEIGETADALAKNQPNEIKDGIGDSVITLIILSHQCGYTLEECVQAAWEEIKDRKGETINGTFIKS